MKAAAITADFVDLRTVKTRKLVQLVLEIPVERAKEALDTLGFPMSDRPIPVAVALLQAPRAQEKPSQEKTPGERARIRSVLMCKTPAFQLWASAHPLWRKGLSAEDFLRERCGLESRREIAEDRAAFNRFLAFESQYLLETGQLTEQRG